jgi:very-short-patch-repair endonuclease
LRHLLAPIADGCRSEWGIRGVTHVLPGPSACPPWVQQHRVRLPTGRWVALDAACPEARVAVELDGAALHGSRSARERDLRRDSALAVLGWVVLRFGYARLVSEPECCRREIEAVVQLRLREP